MEEESWGSQGEMHSQLTRNVKAKFFWGCFISVEELKDGNKRNGQGKIHVTTGQ